MIQTRNRTVSVAAVLLGVLSAEAAQAQSVSCEHLQQLQTLGLDRFAGIAGQRTYPGSAEATLVLPGAEECELNGLDTDAPEYKCTWTGFADEGEAEDARLDLGEQVRGCLPSGYHSRDRNSELSGSSNYYTRFTLDSFQPQIIVARRYSRATRRYSVTFTYEMDLPES